MPPPRISRRIINLFHSSRQRKQPPISVAASISSIPSPATHSISASPLQCTSVSLSNPAATVRKFTTSPRPRARGTPSWPESEPGDLTVVEYHRLSNAFIENLVSQLEEIQEEREEVDVEYSAGVLTLKFPPHGTYVLNKQPPNKQIWLSSPVSGPKRYDWVADEGQELGKGGWKKGEWVYLRDGSTLSGLLEKEIGVVIGGEEVL